MTKKLGLALGSGAARGWAHVGVLRAFEEVGLKPDVIAGCSVGALVGGAWVLDAMEDFDAWARALSPLSALQSFSIGVGKGGMVAADRVFEEFREKDRAMEETAVRFGAVATDLATGEAVWLTTGSIIDAARASSAIPVLLQSVPRDGHWLIDGALADPVPIALARELGADIVVSVDLNAVPRVLDRFDAPAPSAPVLRPADKDADEGWPAAVTKFVADTKHYVEGQIAAAKARSLSTPRLFETALAVNDIFQMHLANARAASDPPDIALRPDMRDALPNAFDRADEFIERGRQAALDAAPAIKAALSET